jgi:Brp/Blh family beta-carotene 15,15'-monooxygenase
MKPVSGRLFTVARSFSRGAIIFAVIASLFFRQLISHSNLSWQLGLSIVALLIGIPHGAVDHLIAIPCKSPTVFFGFILLYVGIAVLAVLALLRWSVFGFQVVVWMSALHFGFGDASFISQHDDLIDRDRSRLALKIVYAIPAGTLPVVIPLVQSQSTDALMRVNPSLVDWAGTYAGSLKIAVASIALISIITLALFQRYQEVLDLFLLAALAFCAPPLVAFAFYFGCWHAVRHTARLTLLLPTAVAAAAAGNIKKSFASAVIPGLPALVGTGIVAVALALVNRDSFNSTLLWSLLVVVWALTVPHMLVTSSLDVKALTNS